MKNQTSQGHLLPIIVMMFLYAMIAVVTNLAAPVGNIWKMDFEGSDNANTLGMLGNLMNFLAYLFMGIPAGNLLSRIGYKKTALSGIALGAIGVGIQLVSGFFPEGALSGFVVYLIGAFVSGFCVCILNTVVNPMLNLLGGGGNRGNQLNLFGSSINSLAGTLTPLLVGVLIGGQIVKETSIFDVSLVLYIALAIFVVAFLVLLFVPIQDPQQTGSNVVYEHSPWSFRHFVLGAIGVFVYVGVEVGLPGTLFYYLTDVTEQGAHLMGNVSAIAGGVTATYWLLMLIGRFLGGMIAGKVSSKLMLASTTFVAALLIVGVLLVDNKTTCLMPVFTGTGFMQAQIPLVAVFVMLCGLCTSVMWASIFNLATEGLGKYTAKASGIFMMMVVGGGVLPLLQSQVADHIGYISSYIIPLCGMLYLLFYALLGSKRVSKGIPVD